MKHTLYGVISIALLAVPSTAAVAQNSPYVVSPNGQYLGNLSNNQYDPNSISNPYGQYGSPYSPNSVNNPYGQYGSPYSPNSANNPYATNPPRVYAPSSNTYGTQNPYQR
ncbi:MAG: hypothetical protein ACK4HD_07430 [Pannonibacter phragmitetus]